MLVLSYSLQSGRGEAEECFWLIVAYASGGDSPLNGSDIVDANSALVKEVACFAPAGI